MPSGIPDFRTPGTGLWENVDPMEVAHIDAFRRDPDRFWHFYGNRFATLEDKLPNPAHEAIAELERRGLVRGVITQNIDRLHRTAGSSGLSRCTARSSGASACAATRGWAIERGARAAALGASARRFARPASRR